MATVKDTVVFSIHDVKSYKEKTDAPHQSKRYVLENDDAFYLESPVKKEDVILLNKYSKEYTERALKATVAFATDVYKEDGDLNEVSYTVPYQEDSLTVVVAKDQGNYTIHTENPVAHMDGSKAIAARMKALNKAMAED